MATSVKLAMTFLVLNLILGTTIFIVNYSGEAARGILRLTTHWMVTGVLISGFIRRQTRAWQWARLLGGLSVVFGLLGGSALLATAGLATGASPERIRLVGAQALMQVGLVLAAVVALGTVSARDYFGLRCPTCGSMRARAAGFCFSSCRCRDCGAAWDVRA